MLKFRRWTDKAVYADESYSGGVRKGKRGRSAADKSFVFGLFKRDGKLHTMMLANTTSKTLVGLILAHVQPDNIVYTDSYHSCDRLVSTRKIDRKLVIKSE